MKEEKLLSTVASTTTSSEPIASTTGEELDRHWQGVVKRRSFLKGLGMAGATLSAGAILSTRGSAQAIATAGRLSAGDVG